jgi:predicted RNase H-like HicB family nuclease
LLDQVRQAVDLYFEAAAAEGLPLKHASESVRLVELTV